MAESTDIFCGVQTVRLCDRKRGTCKHILHLSSQPSAVHLLSDDLAVVTCVSSCSIWKGSRCLRTISPNLSAPRRGNCSHICASAVSDNLLFLVVHGEVCIGCAIVVAPCLCAHYTTYLHWSQYPQQLQYSTLQTSNNSGLPSKSQHLQKQQPTYQEGPATVHCAIFCSFCAVFCHILYDTTLAAPGCCASDGQRGSTHLTHHAYLLLSGTL